MNPNTLKLLKESIAHWERLATGKRKPREEPDGSNCALCRTFYWGNESAGIHACHGCPVSEKSGRSGCKDTPYDKVTAYMDRRYRSRLLKGMFDTKEFKTIAKQELRFLRSLLPKTKA